MLGNLKVKSLDQEYGFLSSAYNCSTLKQTSISPKDRSWNQTHDMLTVNKMSGIN